MRIGGHPAYVRVVVDFTGATISGGDVAALDAQPFDGVAVLSISRPGVRTLVSARSAGGVGVRLAAAAGRLRIDLRSPGGMFKYLSYVVVSGERLAIDLWRSAPPSSAAQIRNAANGCLALDSVRVSRGLVVAAGREHGLFEHQFQAVVRGRDGSILARTHVLAGAGRWSARVRYHAGAGQPGTFEAAAASAKDGALACLVQVRVTLPAAP